MSTVKSHPTYQEVVKAKMLQRLKFALSFGAVLLSTFIFLDYLVYPQDIEKFFLIRCISTGIMLVLILAIFLRRFSLTSLFVIGDIGVIQAGAAICYMIYISDGSQSSYYQGLSLCFIGSLTINCFRVWHNAFCGFTIFLLYLLAVFLSHTPIIYPDLAKALFFMMGNFGFMLIVTHLFSLQHRNEFEKSRLLAIQAIELDKANHRLIASEKLKDEFFANVSHELRTPLTLILGPIRRQLADKELNLPIKKDLILVEKNATLLLKHVNDLLDISRLDAGKIMLHQTTFDMARLLRRIASYFEIAAHDRGIQVQILTPSELFVAADEIKIERVLFNLLSNAFKFCNTNGTVTCELKQIENSYEFSVSDTGPGVPDHMKKSIFERFSQVDGSVTRRFGGTGLGLAIAAEFVKLHEGSLHVDDGPENGAKFIVRLPIKSLSLPSTENIANIPDQSLELSRLAIAENTIYFPTVSQLIDADETKPKILVVEDNPDMNAFICESLGDEFVIEQAFDGKSAYESAQKSPPDLILSDIMMPELSGEQLLKKIRENPLTENTQVLLLTAKADENLREDLLNEGAQDFLNKPFVVGELKARVRNLVAIKKAKDILGEELETKDKDLASLAKEITASKKIAESSLKQAAKALLLKDEFLMNLSHELRTPLTAILGWADLIEADCSETGDLKLGIETIKRNAVNLARHIDDLLDIHKMEKSTLSLKVGKTTLLEPIEAAIQTLSVAAQNKSIAVQKKIINPSVMIDCDVGRINQVVLNLLSNAIKFTPQGGQIEISLEKDPHAARIVVRDSGEGIEEDFLPHVFERLRQGDSSTTKRHSGLGIGLAISKSLVEMHGGSIEVQSEGKGKGSTFTVKLPLSQSGHFRFNPEEQSV